MHRYTRILPVVVLSLGFTANFAQAQVRSQGNDKIKETSVAYIAKHADGTKERVVVAYEGWVSHRIWQTGSAARPLEGKMVDDRKCNITTNAYVARRAYLVSHSGVRAPVQAYENIYQISKFVDRGPDNKFEALTRHVTCGDVLASFQQRVEDVKSSLIGTFDKIVDSDDDVSRKRLVAMLKAKEIGKAP